MRYTIGAVCGPVLGVIALRQVTWGAIMWVQSCGSNHVGPTVKAGPMPDALRQVTWGPVTMGSNHMGCNHVRPTVTDGPMPDAVPSACTLQWKADRE